MAHRAQGGLGMRATLPGRASKIPHGTTLVKTPILTSLSRDTTAAPLDPIDTWHWKLLLDTLTAALEN